MEINVKGYTVLVDEEDLEKVSKYRWVLDKAYFNREGTVYFRANQQVDKRSIPIRLHRLICGCEFKDGMHVDHINHDTLDNRKCNLRKCTPQENKRNQFCRSDNLSGYKGVSYKASEGKYVVRIVYDNKRHIIGHYTDPIEAARAYDIQAIRHYGEFAYTNFPRENYIEGATNE